MHGFSITDYLETDRSNAALRRRLLFGHGLLSDEVASSLSGVVAASSGERDGDGNPCKLWLYAEPSAFELQVRVQLIGHL